MKEKDKQIVCQLADDFPFILALERAEIKALKKLLETSIGMDKFLEKANPAAYRGSKETSKRAEWESILGKIELLGNQRRENENLSKV